MKTINHSTTYFIALVLLTSLLSLSLPFSKAHALSCLNPSEMIDIYVTDERYNIAVVVGGKVETLGEEHDQTITVKENLRGYTSNSVTFAYDETWAYLCAGNPASAGTEAVYVTTDGLVAQVIDVNSTLYDELVTALDEAPVIVTPTPDTGDETKRTLMLRIVDLLQQVISLLSGETTLPPAEPDPTPSAEAMIGMTIDEAEFYANANNIMFRVVEIDGEQQLVTEDYRPGRINASVENDVVVSYEIEGNESTQEDMHDDIIGMTRAEAEAYAEAKGVMFRVGRIDDEYLPLTMDLRPGRITAEIEDDVIVDYSVEASLSL